VTVKLSNKMSWTPLPELLKIKRKSVTDANVLSSEPVPVVFTTFDIEASEIENAKLEKVVDVMLWFTSDSQMSPF